MKKLFFLSVLSLYLLAGCASTVEPTAMPVQSNPSATNAVVAPLAVATPTTPLRPVGNCQSHLMGRVVDASGKLVKGATIELRGSAVKPTTPKAVSDDNGLYGFAGLCAGSYAFTVTPPGKPAEALAETITVDGANTGKADLKIK